MILFIVGAFAFGFMLAAVIADRNFKSKIREQIRVVQYHYESQSTDKPYHVIGILAYTIQVLKQLEETI
jgi:hypothetical protein